MHYGPYTSLSYIRSVIDTANNLQPDIIALTGDYVHRTPRTIEPGIRILRFLDARNGTLAVLGNHDHWEGADACRDAFSRIAIPLVDNDYRYLTEHGLSKTPGSRASLCIAGVGDLWEDEVSFDKALGTVPDTIPRLLLSHNPDVAEIIDRKTRVDLVLSGHTHGGQGNVPFFTAKYLPTRYGDKYLEGLCKGPRCPVIVTSGVGISGIPMRLGAPPDIGIIRLTRNDSNEA